MNDTLLTVNASERVARLHAEATVRNLRQQRTAPVAKLAAQLLRSVAARLDRDSRASALAVAYDYDVVRRLGQQRA